MVASSKMRAHNILERINQFTIRLLPPIFFIFILIYYTQYIGNLCYGPLRSDFDSQNFITWQYAATTGQIPYKEVSYYYGIFNYYAFTNYYVQLIYFICAGIVMGLYCVVVIKSIIKNVYLATILGLFFLIFTEYQVGYTVITRYYLTPLVVWFASHAIHQYNSTYTSKKNQSIQFFVLGVVCAVLTASINDQGIYSTLISSIMLLLFIKMNRLKNAFAYILGWVLGILPFLIYFSHQGNLIDFVKEFINIRWMSEFAKIPVDQNLLSPMHILIMLAAVFATAELSYRYVTRTNTLNYKYYLLFGWTATLYIFESKFSIRFFVDQQVYFIAVLIITLLFSEIYLGLQKSYKPNICLLWIAGLFLIPLIYIHQPKPFNEFSKKITNYYGKDLHTKIINRFGFTEHNSCLANNFSKENMNELVDYKKIYEIVKTDANSSKSQNSLIYSFPGDPILYAYFQQKIPKYINIYDASAKQAQLINIDYMIKNNIKYVIYNSKISSIQDDVPDFIRGSYLFSYISNRYEIINKVNDYLILKKSEGSTNKTATLDDHMNTIVNLGSIPKLEGIRCAKYIKKTKNINKDDKLDDQAVFIFSPKSVFDSPNKIKFVFESGVNGSLNFNSCNIPGDSCIISIQKIPFHNQGKISVENINVEQSSIMQIIMNSDLTRCLW